MEFIMKKILAFVVLVTIVFNNAFALSLSDLPPQLKTKFNNERLSISTSTTTSMSGGSYYWGSGISTSSISGRTREIWTPYLGNSAINKTDFFKIAGYPDEAIRYEELLNHNKKLDQIGGVILGVGTVVSTIGLIMMLSSISDLDDDIMYDGLITGTVGLGIVLLSYPVYASKKDDSMFSISFAIRIAEDYNETLIKKLARGL